MSATSGGGEDIASLSRKIDVFSRLNVLEAFHMHAFVISGASISVGGGISEVEGAVGQ